MAGSTGQPKMSEILEWEIKKTSKLRKILDDVAIKEQTRKILKFILKGPF
jgi:hypothetical protein